MGNARSGRDIDAALRLKGFRRDMEGKHIRYFLTDEEQIRTMISHGDLGTTIGAPLISKMSRQLRLTKQQFLDFVDCTISEEDYRAILRDQGIWGNAS